MLAFRHFMTMGTSTVIILGYSTLATSQEVQTVESSDTTETTIIPVLNKSKLRSETFNEVNETSNTESAIQVTPSEPENFEVAIIPVLNKSKPQREEPDEEEENSITETSTQITPTELENSEIAIVPVLNKSKLQAEELDGINSNSGSEESSEEIEILIVQTESDSPTNNEPDSEESTPNSQEPILLEQESEENIQPSDEQLLLDNLQPNSDGEAEDIDPADIPNLRTIEDLNPSSNPLLFPTEADEVQTPLSQAITLEEAIELARRNNRDLQVSQLSLARAEEALRVALASEYPTLDTQIDFQRADSATTELQLQNQVFLGQQDTTTTSLNSQLQLNYNLLTGGSRPAQIRAAERQVRFNQLDVERITEQIRFQVTDDYYDLQDTDAQVNIQLASVRNAEQSLRDAQLLEQAGLGTRFDVLRAEVDLANDQQQLVLSIANQRTARRQLVDTLSLGQQVELTAADEIAIAGAWDISMEETIILAYKNRAELEQFLVQREIDEQQRIIQRSAIKPQLSLFANYNILNLLDDDFAPADGFTFGATLQWRLFDGGAAKASVAQEEIDIELAETQFADQRNQVRIEVESAYFSLQANQRNIQTAAVAVELAQESLRLARLRFQAGVGTQTDVINSQTELTTAQNNLLRAIIDYNRALNSLQRAVSNLPDGQLFDLP